MKMWTDALAIASEAVVVAALGRAYRLLSASDLSDLQIVQCQGEAALKFSAQGLASV